MSDIVITVRGETYVRDASGEWAWYDRPIENPSTQRWIVPARFRDVLDALHQAQEVVRGRYQPYYAAYVSACAGQPGRPYEYIIWIGEQWRTWWADMGRTGRVEDARTPSDHAPFAGWLAERYPAVDLAICNAATEA